MTVNYTTNLQLGQPVTGTESGTWGDDVNNSVTSYLDIAIAGGLAITITTADVTLSLTQGTSSATNIGSTTAQYAILNISGAMTAARNLILPSSSRQYVINNNTTGGFALTVKGAATTGVTMINGESSHIYWNGSDYAKVSSVNGASGAGSFTSITDSGNLTFTGTGNRITGDFSNATIASRVAFQTSTANSNTIVAAIPSGTASIAQWQAFNNSDPTNAGLGQFAALSTEITIRSGASGTGTNLPMTFYTGGSERMRLDTSGNVGIGSTQVSGLSLRISKSMTPGTDSGATDAYGVRVDGTISATATNAVRLYSSYPSTAASAFTLGTLSHYQANGGTVGAGSAITSQYGFQADSGLVGATTNIGFLVNDIGGASATTGKSNFGFYSALSTASGGGSAWNIYANGTAPNYFSGNVGIGTNSPSNRLQVGDGTADTRATFRPNSAFAIGVANGAGFAGWIGGSGVADNMVFSSSGGSERMRIDASGNVGIGTSSAGNKLEVTSSGQNIVVSRSTGSYGAFQRAAPTGQQTYDFYTINSVEVARITGDPSYLGFSTGSAATERMRIDSSGVVGINNTSPSTWATRLTVQGTVAILGNASLTGANPTYQGALRLIENPTTIASTGGIEFFTSTFGSGYGWKMTSIDSSGVQLTFATRQNSATWSEIMRLDSSGNVGIGTSSPSYNLHVRNGGGNGTIGVQYGTSTVTLLSAYAAQGDLQVTGANPITFTNNSTERMRIDSSGNVGIGTSSPAQKLDVKGILQLTNSTTPANTSYVYDGGGLLLASNNSNPMYFYTGGSERMRIDSSGNVLVGTTTAQTGAVLAVTGGIQGTIKSGTAVASTSGTSIDFTSIPSWVKRITVMFNGVSTNGTSQVRVRIGPSGGVETSGYLGVSQTTLGSSTNTQSFTAGFDLYDGGAAAAVRNGMFVLALLDAATNTWTAMANIGQSNEARMIVLGGVKPLAGTLSIVRITTVNGTDIFDAGSINILYEG